MNFYLFPLIIISNICCSVVIQIIIGLRKNQAFLVLLYVTTVHITYNFKSFWNAFLLYYAMSNLQISSNVLVYDSSILLSLIANNVNRVIVIMNFKWFKYLLPLLPPKKHHEILLLKKYIDWNFLFIDHNFEYMLL